MGRQLMVGDQLTDVVPHVQEPCPSPVPPLPVPPHGGRVGGGLWLWALAERSLPGSCLQVQIPPLCMPACLSVWRRWHCSPEPMPSPLKIRF